MLAYQKNKRIKKSQKNKKSMLTHNQKKTQHVLRMFGFIIISYTFESIPISL